MNVAERRFGSALDSWFVITTAIVLAVAGGALFIALKQGHLLAAIAPLAVIGLFAWNVVGTSYVVSADALVVRCLIYRRTVPLSAVKRLTATRDPFAAPAMSVDRIIVEYGEYGDRSVMVSPRDRVGFVRAIRAHAPAVVLQGLSD